MDRVTIIPIYAAGESRSHVDVAHVHAEDHRIPMREIEDRGHGLPGATDPTVFRFTVHECPLAGCGVRVTTTMLHKLRIGELTGLVIEHEDGRLEMYGDVPENWRTNERSVITG